MPRLIQDSATRHLLSTPGYPPVTPYLTYPPLHPLKDPLAPHLVRMSTPPLMSQQVALQPPSQRESAVTSSRVPVLLVLAVSLLCATLLVGQGRFGSYKYGQRIRVALTEPPVHVAPDDAIDQPGTDAWSGQNTAVS